MSCMSILRPCSFAFLLLAALAMPAAAAGLTILSPASAAAGARELAAQFTAKTGIAVAVAVKAGRQIPDISTPEKFRAALLAAKGVAYADPAAGTSAGKVIDRMLSAPEFSGVKRVPVQGLAVGGLLSGKADIALQM